MGIRQRYRDAEARAASVWHLSEPPSGQPIPDVASRVETPVPPREWIYEPLIDVRRRLRRFRLKRFPTVYVVFLWLGFWWSGRFGVESFFWAALWTFLWLDPLLTFSQGTGRGFAGRCWLEEEERSPGAVVLEARVMEAVKRSKLRVRRQATWETKKRRLFRAHTWSFVGGLRLRVETPLGPGRPRVEINASNLQAAPEFRALKGLIWAAIHELPDETTELDSMIQGVA